MPRTEFARKTRREALQRSNGLCEATGEQYGLEPGQRCCQPLSYGVEFDHGLACELGGDNSLDNCVAICRACHKRKTANDVRQIRKTDRVRDKADGTFWKQGRPIPGSRTSPVKKRLTSRGERTEWR